MGKFPLILSLFKQKRFWYLAPRFRADEVTTVPPRSVLVYPESLTGSPMAQQLLELGVPPEEQSTVIRKIREFARVAEPDQHITVVIVDITVGSLGNIDYQDIIDYVEREEINVHVAPGNPTIRISRCVPAARSSVEGLTRARFDNLEEDIINRNPMCGVCFKDFAECVDELITTFPCPSRHCYHVHCIVQWLNRDHVCPLCQYPMPPMEDVPETWLDHQIPDMEEDVPETRLDHQNPNMEEDGDRAGPSNP